MSEPALPIYEIFDGRHRFIFPDATQLEVLHPQRDSVGSLWAEVVAKRGDEHLLNRARFNLLDLRARHRFHMAMASRDGEIDWGARLLFALEHVLQTLQESETGSESDEPITSPQNLVEPFPVEVLPTALAHFVTEAAGALPCPPDFLGVLMLPLLGVAIGTSRVLAVKPNWYEGPRFYAAVVAEPGSKKSPALDLVSTPYRIRQRTLYTTYLHEKARYQHQLAQYERDFGDGKPRRSIGRMTRHQTFQAPLEPVMPQVFSTDATLEALAALLEQNPRGVAFIQDELTGWVLAMNQYKGGKGADRHGWLSFWNGASVIVNRKTRKEPVVLDNPFVGVAGCLPPDMLGALPDERGREDGFLHRILFAFPDRMLVRWTEASVSDEAIEGYQRVCERLWELQGVSPQAPRVVAWDTTGRQTFIEFANELYAELADPDFPEMLRGPFSKLEGYGARLALLLHLCRLVCGEAPLEAVDKVSVLGAVALVHYFKSHARRVYARLQATPEDQQVARALAWIVRQGGQVTARALLRHHVGGVKTTSEAIQLLHTLEERGYGTVQEGSKRRVTFAVT